MCVRVYVCVSGEWHSGHHCWMAILITSPHAKITTEAADRKHTETHISPSNVAKTLGAQTKQTLNQDGNGGEGGKEGGKERKKEVTFWQHRAIDYTVQYVTAEAAEVAVFEDLKSLKFFINEQQ